MSALDQSLAAESTPRPELEASLIIPVWNARSYIPGLVASLAAQTLSRVCFEVIIADDGSSDGTAELAMELDPAVRVLRVGHSNAYTARNRAVEQARADVLVFVDADCRPDPDWLERGLEAAKKAEIVAGRIDLALPSEYTLWSVLDVETTKNHAMQVQTNNAETANLFVRRTVFEAVGGFDDSEPGHGDFDFVERAVEMGHQLVYEPRARVTHPTRDQARSFLSNVWQMHRSYGARQARAGRRPIRFKLRTWIPLISPLRVRRRYGHPLGLNRERFDNASVRPSRVTECLAMVWMYLLLPYFQGCAQIHGWWTQRRA